MRFAMLWGNTPVTTWYLSGDRIPPCLPEMSRLWNPCQGQLLPLIKPLVGPSKTWKSLTFKLSSLHGKENGSPLSAYGACSAVFQHDPRRGAAGGQWPQQARRLPVRANLQGDHQVRDNQAARRHRRRDKTVHLHPQQRARCVVRVAQQVHDVPGQRRPARLLLRQPGHHDHPALHLVHQSRGQRLQRRPERLRHQRHVVAVHLA